MQCNAMHHCSDGGQLVLDWHFTTSCHLQSFSDFVRKFTCCTSRQRNMLKLPAPLTSCRQAAATIYPSQACNGSAQLQPWARPAEPGPISQYAPSSRPAAPAHAAPPADRMYATDVRQTDVRQQHHRFMPRLLGAGHNKIGVGIGERRIFFFVWVVRVSIFFTAGDQTCGGVLHCLPPSYRAISDSEQEAVSCSSPAMMTRVPELLHW